MNLAEFGGENEGTLNSNGIHLYSPQRKSGKNRNNKGLGPNNSFPKLETYEQSELTCLRSSAFELACEQVENAMKIVVNQANKNCFSQVQQFFIDHFCASKYTFHKNEPFPCAVLLAGTSVVDSEIWSKPLKQKIQEVFPFVLTVKSKDIIAMKTPRNLLHFVLIQLDIILKRKEDVELKWFCEEYERIENGVKSGERFDQFEKLQVLHSLDNSNDNVFSRMNNFHKRNQPVVTSTIVQDLEDNLGPYFQKADNTTVYQDMLFQKVSETNLSLFRSSNKTQNRITIENRLQMLENEVSKLGTILDKLRNEYKELELNNIESFYKDYYVEVARCYQQTIDELNQLGNRKCNVKSMHYMSKERKNIIGKMYSKLAELDIDLSTSTENNPSQKSTEYFTNKNISVIIAFEDYEKIEQQIIGDFCGLWRDFKSSIHFGFIFEVSSASSPCYRRMSLNVSQHLNLKTFTLADPTKSFHNIIYSLLISGELPITLPGSVLRWLYSSQLQDFYNPITGFAQCLRYILMEHFIQYPYNFLAFHQNPTKLLDMAGIKKCDELLDVLCQRDINRIHRKFDSQKKTKAELSQCLTRISQCRVFSRICYDCFEICLNYFVPQSSNQSASNSFMDIFIAFEEGNLGSSEAWILVEKAIPFARTSLLLKIVQEWQQCILVQNVDFVNKSEEGEDFNKDIGDFANLCESIDGIQDVLVYVMENLEEEEEEIKSFTASLSNDFLKVFRQMLPFCSNLRNYNAHQIFRYIPGWVMMDNEPTLKISIKLRLNYQEKISKTLYSVPSLLKSIVNDDDPNIKMLMERQSMKQVLKESKTTWAYDMHHLFKIYSNFSGISISLSELYSEFHDAIELDKPRRKKQKQSSLKTNPEARFMQALTAMETVGYLKIRKNGNNGKTNLRPNDSEQMVDKLFFI